MSTDGANAHTPGDRSEEPESLAQLRGDCARMSSRWQHRGPGDPAGDHCGDPVGGRSGPAPTAARPHGVRVPERSARLLDGMSDYGD